LRKTLLSVNLLLLFLLCFITPCAKASVITEPTPYLGSYVMDKICVPDEKTALALIDIVFENAYPGSIKNNMYESSVLYLEEKDIWSITYKIHNANTITDNKYPQICTININRSDAEITFEDIEKSIICIPDHKTALKIGEIILKVHFPKYADEDLDLILTYLPMDDPSLEDGIWVLEFLPIKTENPLSSFLMNFNFIHFPFEKAGLIAIQQENGKVLMNGIFNK